MLNAAGELVAPRGVCEDLKPAKRKSKRHVCKNSRAASAFGIVLGYARLGSDGCLHRSYAGA